MAKALFNTSDQSNFILNMDLDRYRRFCAKLLAAILWMTAGSVAIHQLTYTSSADLSEMTGQGGFGAVIALVLIMLRSTAVVFSILGVAAIITMLIGMMRKQFTRSTAVPYLLLLGALLWSAFSMLFAYDMNYALFGQDGRDEGWIALFMYAAMFYLGTMLRRKENIGRFLQSILILGIAENIWAILQAQPFFDFPNAYDIVEPLLYDHLRLPSGFTDSPITFAMLLAMLLAVSIAAAFCAEKRSLRVTALVCAGLSMLMTLKTQTIAGVIAAAGAVLVTVGFVIVRRKSAGKAKWLVPLVVAAAAGLSCVWTYFTPAINGAQGLYSEQKLENGFALYDGGIVWDDGHYRISVAGGYVPSQADFDIHNAADTLRYCWSEGVRVIKMYPLVGAGPDNFAFTQLHTSMVLENNANTIDRPYNDFLFIAATRGLPTLALYIALLIACAVIVRRRRMAAYGWMAAAAVCGIGSYLAAAFAGISVLSVAPLFWTLLGIVVGEPIAEKVQREKAPRPAKKPHPEKKKRKK